MNLVDMSRPSLPIRERIVIGLAVLCLVWATWSMGGVLVWARMTTLALASACLLTAVFPFGQRRWGPLKTLLSFIPFWLGLFVVLYMLLQWVNAAWVFERNAEGRAVAMRTEYMRSLPSGVRALPGMIDPLVMCSVIAPAWMLMCAVWAGLRRPRSMRIIMWAMVVNGALFAVVGMLQSILKANYIMWIFDPKTGTRAFWGTMLNANHSAAFMNLALVAALALFFHYTGRHSRSRELSQGGVYLMLIPFSAIIVAGIVQAMSRAGILVTALMALVVICIALARAARMLLERGQRSMIVAVSVVCLVFLGGAVALVRSSVDIQLLESELRSMISVAESPEEDLRFHINKASIELWQRKRDFGWGAGCYRYFIGNVQKKYPPLVRFKGRYEIAYAHNDYVNYLCDIGLVGAIPLGICVFGPSLYVLIFRRRGLDGMALMGIAGMGVVMLHAFVEFFMQHPLVLAQYFLLLGCICRSASRRHYMEIKAEQDEARAIPLHEWRGGQPFA